MTKQTTVELIGMDEIEKAYEPGIGRHWFDRDTMRFFKCRLPQYGYKGAGGVFFTSSEQRPGGVRLYSVRRLVGPGKIATHGDFNAYTKGVADRMARKLAAGEAEAVK